MTEIRSTSNNINIFFPDVLRKIWIDGKRDWSVYSREPYRYFWDRYIREARTK